MTPTERQIAAVVMIAAGLLFGPAPSQAANSIGAVDAIEGEVLVVHKGSHNPEMATVGSAIYQRDIIQTMKNARVRIRFEDETLVSLGSDGTLKITEFVYSPEQKKRSGRFSVPKGILRTVMNLFVPDTKFEVHTSTAVASVRGTDWIMRATPKVTMAVCMEGAVAMSPTDSAPGAEIVLNQGEGTVIPRGGSPDPKQTWPQDQVRSFIDQTRVR